jgi:hypothetical protein
MSDLRIEKPAAPRPLRLGVMGEFSAGKSTLCNLLLGARPLTERVTATRLSPVWISHGAPRLERERLDGSREALALGDLERVPMDGTRSIRLFMEAEALEMFDLIDFPGISDPNMPSEVWERLVPEVDAILWCTHANQAWRQSEAEVWRSIPGEVKARSLLLVTRFDTILGERDRGRVLARVRLETAGAFAGIFPISLTQALAGAEDPEAWEASGAEPFTAHLIEMIAELQVMLEKGQIAERAPYLEAAPQEAAPGDVFAMDDIARPAAEPEEGGLFAEPVADAAPAQETPEAGPQGPTRDPAAPHAPAPGFDGDADESPIRKAPISLLSRRRTGEPDAAAPAVQPRRVAPEGSRRTERPTEDAGTRAMRMDALKDELAKATASPEALREAMSRR